MLNIVIAVGLIVTLVSFIPVVRQLASHPRGLRILFFAEMWERFSYYGMRALLILYLTQHFLFDDPSAAAQYGAYTSLVYLTPLFGGFIADRLLGTRKAVAFGALLLVAGHFTMAAEGPPARQYIEQGGARYEVRFEGRADARRSRIEVQGKLYDLVPATGGALEVRGLPAGGSLTRSLPAGSYRTIEERSGFFTGVFYLALAFIIMGVGFLKPNISTLVGQLYPRGDPRRDPGFTLYYYGINMGSFWASVICGLLGQTVGWWAGFGLAGVGMLAGFLVFVLGKRLLQGKGEPPDPVALRRRVAGPVTRESLVYLGGVAGVAVVWLLVQHYAAVGTLLGAGSVGVVGYLGWFMVARCTRVERQRMLLALLLMAGAVVFFTLFEQAGSSLNLFTQRNVQLPNHGFLTVTAAQVQSFNPGFILLLAPLFSAMWVGLGRRDRDPDPLLKFGLGLVQVGLGFFVLVWSAGLADADYRIPLICMALTYLLHTTGELCLSPIGLSQVSKLSVPALVATMMATWFLASSWAQWVGALIARVAGTETVGGVVLDPRLALATSLSVFNFLGWLGVGAGALFLLLSPFLKHWSHGADEPDAGDAGAAISPAFDGDRQGARIPAQGSQA